MRLLMTARAKGQSDGIPIRLYKGPYSHDDLAQFSSIQMLEKNISKITFGKLRQGKRIEGQFFPKQCSHTEGFYGNS